MFDIDENSFIETEQVSERVLSADFAQKGHMWIDRLYQGTLSRKVIVLIRYNDKIVFSVDLGKNWIFEDAVLATGPNVKTLQRRFQIMWSRWLNRQPNQVPSRDRSRSSAYNRRFASLD